MGSCSKYHREGSHGGWDCPVCKCQSIHRLAVCWRDAIRRDVNWICILYGEPDAKL